MCGATESDLEEDVPPSGVRKNLFEQFDYNEDECAPNTTTNNEYKESEEITVSNFEADTMIMDDEYETLNESSKLVENKRPERISGVFKDNQSVIIRKSCYDEKQSSVGSVEHEHSQIVKRRNEDSEKNEQSVIVKSEKEVVNEDEIVVINSDSESEIEYLGEGEMDVMVDLTKVKKEKTDASGSPAAGSSNISSTTGSSNMSPSERKLYRKKLKKMVKRNTDGRIMCPMSCKSSFTTYNNMYIHVENEICTKPVSERVNLRCQWSNCNFSCVTAANMRNHHLSHLEIKDYVCPVCGRDYAHGSSLVNHKHGKHPDIYPPTADWLAKQGLTKSDAKGGSSKKKKSKKKKKKKTCLVLILRLLTFRRILMLRLWKTM